jgi:hypothetical protein
MNYVFSEYFIVFKYCFDFSYDYFGFSQYTHSGIDPCIWIKESRVGSRFVGQEDANRQ